MIPTNEILAIIGALVAALAAIGAFQKSRAEVSKTLVDATLSIVTRLESQVQSMMVDRDRMGRELAMAQEQLAIMSHEFDSCRTKLGMLMERAGIEDKPIPSESKHEIN